MAERHFSKARPKEKMTPGKFVEMYAERLKLLDDALDMDVCWAKDSAIMLHDMRRPNAIRQGILYTKAELEDGVFEIVGDMERRARKFLQTY